MSSQDLAAQLFLLPNAVQLRELHVSDGGTSVIITFWLLPAQGRLFGSSFISDVRVRFQQGRVRLDPSLYGRFEFQDVMQLTAPPPPPPSE